MLKQRYPWAHRKPRRQTPRGGITDTSAQFQPTLDGRHRHLKSCWDDIYCLLYGLSNDQRLRLLLQLGGQAPRRLSANVFTRAIRHELARRAPPERQADILREALRRLRHG